jgi:phosphatidylglycerol:prolipoprotein diacylglycerol transferase
MGVFEETYGTVSTLPWAMNLGDGLLRHPVALYEILFLLILWIAIYQFEKKYALANGARFKIFMMAYLCFRFILDFIKPHYTFNIGLSTIQITCVVGLMYYGRYLLKPSLLIEN